MDEEEDKGLSKVFERIESRTVTRNSRTVVRDIGRTLDGEWRWTVLIVG